MKQSYDMRWVNHHSYSYVNVAKQYNLINHDHKLGQQSSIAINNNINSNSNNKKSSSNDDID